MTLAAALLLSACEKWPASYHSLNLAWTECASTKAAGTKASGEATTWLTLEYTDDGLAVILTDAEMNCAINIDGLDEYVNIEDNVITYTIIQSFRANCNCLIERVSSTITGLETGKKYVLYYSYGMENLKPIEFRYEKGFRKRINVKKNLNDTGIVITDGQ